MTHNRAKATIGHVQFLIFLNELTKSKILLEIPEDLEGIHLCFQCHLEKDIIASGTLNAFSSPSFISYMQSGFRMTIAVPRVPTPPTSPTAFLKAKGEMQVATHV